MGLYHITTVYYPSSTVYAIFVYELVCKQTIGLDITCSLNLNQRPLRSLPVCLPQACAHKLVVNATVGHIILTQLSWQRDPFIKVVQSLYPTVYSFITLILFLRLCRQLCLFLVWLLFFGRVSLYLFVNLVFFVPSSGQDRLVGGVVNTKLYKNKKLLICVREDKFASI